MNSMKQTPYIGSRTFEESERDRFFGRETEARDLLALVVSERLVVFYAQSGAGKSSLVNTCLIPDLRTRGYAIFTGRVAGDAPEGIKPDNIFSFNLLRSLALKERNTASLASLTVSEFLKSQTGTRLPEQGSDEQSNLLVIDQFEEIFSTHHEEWEKREDFFKQLAQALEEDPFLSIVLVMREDYIASLDPYSPLVPSRFRRRYYMQRLERDAALDAIKKPVEKIRPYDDGVAERLVNDLSGIKIQSADETTETQPGQFVEGVQLQLVCFKLWKGLDAGDRITHEDLDNLGDVDLALEEHYAERVREVADRKKVSERAIREWFGKKLITPNGTRNMVLRNIRRVDGELPDDVIQALQSDLVRAEQRGAAAFYELTHDRLVEPIVTNNRKWFEASLEKLSPLQQQAALWKDQDRNKSWLSTDQALVELEEWAKNNPNDVGEIETEYLAASRTEQSRLDEQREEERAKLELARKLADEQARSAMWAKRYTAFFLVIAAIAIATSIWAIDTGNKAKDDKNKAQTAEARATSALATAEMANLKTLAQAQISQSGALLASAADNQDETDLAMLLKLEAFKADENPRTRHELLSTLQQFENLEGFINPKSTTIVVNPNGSTLASLSPDGVTLWDLTTRRITNPDPINGHSNRVYPVAINPAGTILVSGDNTGRVVVWDLVKRQPVGKLVAHTAWVDSLIFTPDGKYLASGSDDSTIILWDMTTPTDPQYVSTLEGHTSWITSLAVSRDGKILASAGNDAKIFLWDISDPENAKMISGSPLEGRTSTIYAVALAQDDNLLISGSADGSIILWDITNPEEARAYETSISLPAEFTSVIYSLASSLDGAMLVVGTGSSVSLWNISDPESPKPIGVPINEYDGTPINNLYIFSTIFLSEKTFVSSNSKDILIWDISDSEPFLVFKARFTSSSGVVDSLAYEPETGTLASGNYSGAVVFWNITNAGNPIMLGEPQFAHPGTPREVSFDTFGNVLVSTGDDGALLIDASSLQILGFGDPTPNQLGDSLLAYSYFDARLGEDATRIYAINKPGFGPVTIPGKYLGTDRAITKIVYETADDKNKSLINVWDLTTDKTVLKNLSSEVTWESTARFPFNPDSTALTLTTTDEDGNISASIWSTTGDAKFLARVDGEPITVSENGRYLYYRPILKDTLRTAILDIGTGQSLSTSVEGFASGVSPNGKYLAIASGNSNLSLLDTNTAQVTDGLIRGIFNRFSDDSRVLVFDQKKAGVDYFGFLETGTGALLGPPIAGTFEKFDTTGDLIFFDYNDTTGLNFICSLDIKTGIRTTPLSGNTYLSIPERNRLLYTIDDPDGSSSLNLLDTSTGELVGIARQATFTELSPDKKTLIYRYLNFNTGTYGIGFRDMETGLDLGFIDSADYEGFTEDGQKLIYRRSDTEPNTIGVVDIPSGRHMGESIIPGEFFDYYPPKNLVVTRSADGLINLWDVSKTQLPGRELMAESPVIQAVLSPDQNTLAVIQEGRIFLKNTETGASLVPSFNDHLGGVNGALVSPNSRFLLTSGQDGKTILWNLRTLTMQGSPFEGAGMGFSTDSRAILIFDPSTNQVKFYSVSTFDPIRNPVTGSMVYYSPDRKYFAIVNDTNNVTTVWNNDTLEQMGDPIPGMNASFSPGGRFLAVGNNASDTTALWTLEPFAKIPDVIRGSSYEVTADDKFLVSHTFDYYTTLYRLTSQSARGVSNLKKLYNLNFSRFSPDGRYFYFGGTDNGVNRHELWDLNNLVNVSVDLGDGISSFSPNGKYAAISREAQTNLWMLSNETRVLTDLPSGRADFSPNNRYLSVSDGTEITFVDLFDANQPTQTIPGSYVIFSPDDKFAAVSNDKVIDIYELPRFSIMRTLESDLIPSFSSDSRFLIHPDLVFDLQTRQGIIEAKGAYFNLSYSPDRKFLFIFGNQGISTWAVNSQTLPTPLKGHTGNLVDLAFSPNGKILASIASDGVSLSDTRTGGQLGHTFVGSSIAFNPDGTTIAIGTGNETTLWDISNPNTPVQRGDVIVGRSGKFSPNGELIITTDDDITYVRDVLTRTQIAKIPGTNSQFNSKGDQLAVIDAHTSASSETGSASSGTNKEVNFQITILDLIGLEIHEVPLQNPCNPDNECITIAFNPAGELLAYSEPNPEKGPTIHFRDIENNMDPAGAIKFYSGINNLHIVHDDRLGEILIVETTEGYFVLYDVEKRIQLSNPIQGDFIATTRYKDATRLIYRNNANGNLMLWDLMPKEWISRLCQMVSRNFTGSEWKDFDLIGPYHATCPQWEIEPGLAAGK